MGIVVSAGVAQKGNEEGEPRGHDNGDVGGNGDTSIEDKPAGGRGGLPDPEQ